MDKAYQAMMATVNRVSSIPDELYSRFIAIFRPMSLKTGEFFIRAGEPAHQIAFVVTGALREYYLTREGNEFNKAFILAGNFTGSLYDLLSGEKSTANIVVLKDVDLLVAEYSDYLDVIESDIHFERLGRRNSELLFMKKARREYELLTLSAEDRYRNLMAEHPELDDYVQQYHIASYLGITPEALSRLKKKL